MSEKGFKYDDISKIFNGTSNLTADEKQGLVDDFVSALEANLVLKTDKADEGFDPKAEESAVVYGRWFKNAVAAMKEMTVQSMTASELNASPAGPAEEEFVRTGTLPADYSLTVGGQSYDQYKEMLKPMVLEASASLINDRYGYDKKLKQDGLQKLINKLPDNLTYDPEAPEDDVKAVHNLYSATVGHLMTSTNVQAGHAVGKKIADVIEVDGKPLSRIVEEKYAGQELSVEQKQTAAEYEFAAAVCDKNKKLEFRPALMDPATGIIAQPEHGTPLMQGSAPQKAAYGDNAPLAENAAGPRAGFPGLDSLNTVQNNFKHVQKAYFGHTNSRQYNEMLEFLDKAVKAPSGQEYEDARKQLALRAKAYLEHTGYGKAKHEKSETRRQLAFQILNQTDPDMFKEAMATANARRGEKDKISPERLNNMPGVGLPASTRNKVNLKELVREEDAVNGRKAASGDKNPAPGKENGVKKKNKSQNPDDAFLAAPPKKRKGK